MSTPSAPTPPSDSTGVPRSQRREERVVLIQPRAILIVLGVLLSVVIALRLVILAEKGLTVIAIALFLALALNPAVEFFQRRGFGRGRSVAAVSGIAIAVFSLLALVFIPPLVEQIGEFVKALPGLLKDLTKGRGPLGFLERRYQIVEQMPDLSSARGSEMLTGAASPVLGIAKGIVTVVGGLFIVAFLTLFMMLEGPEWRRRIMELVPERHAGVTERVAAGVYRSVSGFVTGNLLASFLAGAVATLILLIVGVPYALPLGLFAALIEVVPYIGPTVVTVLLSLVALATGPISASVVFVLLLIYHLIEGHTVRPLIYGRALELSPLAVLIAIILGTEVAGVLGALAALPIAGSIQVLIHELLKNRKDGASVAEPG